ncbi:hypothetical protein SDC9_134342 [bioreactor metagenome]|uniref:Uncharacterized protein n=1 Tax=bioreactor metagenome TaxID=1076179 RepID=A0A645DDD1_9ZZZZ
MFFSREAERQHYGSVRQPLHFGANLLCVRLGKLLDALHAEIHVVVFVQLVDIDDLFRLFERAAADQCGRVGGVAAVLCNIVVTVMRGDGRHIVRFALDDRSRSYAAVGFTDDAVAIALGEQSAVYEHAALDCCEIAALFGHLFEEEHRALDEFAGLLRKIAVFFELDHLHEPVEADQRLFGGIAGLDIIHMPGDVAPFVRRDGGLDVRAGELAYDHVEHMRHGRFPRAGLDIFRIHLRAHPVARK